MAHPAVSTDCADCKILFTSADESFHLRQEGECWAIDRVNDRGNRYDNTGRLSAFELVEKYLIWNWATSVRSDLASGKLGTDLYRQGYANGVEVLPVSEGRVEIRSAADRAILSVVKATIFSHLMAKSVDEIEQMVREGLT